MAAPIILTDCFIEIDGVEYSGQGNNIALSMSAAAEDITPFGTDTRVNMGGILDWSLALEFFADESITGQAFFDMLGQTVPVKVRPSAGAVSLTNPSYEGLAVVTEYNPLEGTVGDAHKVALSLVSAGPLSRVTSAV